MRTLILIFIFSLTCQARNLITKIPPADGPAKYPPIPNIIGGTELPSGDKKYDSIIRISTNGAGCTASLVGPQAILTAAHCAPTGSTSTFTIKGKQYSAKMTRSPLYPGVDHDLTLGKVSEKVEGVAYEQITALKLNVKDPVVMYGYGCITPGGGGGNDGILRYGDSKIISFASYNFVTRKPNGAALCFGDSGGPTFGFDGTQIGVASKGNISDTSYLVNLTTQDSKSFFNTWAADNAVDICGVTMDCLGPQPETIIVASDKLGELKFSLKPDTLDPEYVKRHMGMLINYLETGITPNYCF